MRKMAAAAFWDTSAIVPLCCFQPTSSKARQAVRSFPRQVVWWCTPVEAISSLQRLSREGYLSGTDSGNALNRLNHMRAHWTEVQPSEEMRESAERLLRIHRLRAADALQLAAALLWGNNRPRGHAFVAGDFALLEAAALEGFTIFGI